MAHIFRRLAEPTKNTLLSSAKIKGNIPQKRENKALHSETTECALGYHKMPKCRKRNQNTRK